MGRYYVKARVLPTRTTCKQKMPAKISRCVHPQTNYVRTLIREAVYYASFFRLKNVPFLCDFIFYLRFLKVQFLTRGYKAEPWTSFVPMIRRPHIILLIVIGGHEARPQYLQQSICEYVYSFVGTPQQKQQQQQRSSTSSHLGVTTYIFFSFQYVFVPGTFL